MFFDPIQIELIHWLKHFKDKEESLHACFFASPPVETSMFWKLLSNWNLISILNWILNFDETILASACDQFLQSTIFHLCIVRSFYSHKKLYMKNDVMMHWQEMDVLGENWSHVSIVKFLFCAFVLTSIPVPSEYYL